MLKIVWIIGASATGKTTQCERLLQEFDSCVHLRSANVLNDDRARFDARKNRIDSLMEAGRIAPVADMGSTLEIKKTIDFIKDRAIEAGEGNKIKFVLVDGYPRNFEQALQFEKDVSFKFHRLTSIADVYICLWLDRALFFLYVAER